LVFYWWICCHLFDRNWIIIYQLDYLINFFFLIFFYSCAFSSQ
jgi:hypothetical protein